MSNITTTEPRDLTGKPATHDGAYRGRRMSWDEFYKLRPDLRPANDNEGRAAKSSDVPPRHRRPPHFRTAPQFKI